MNNPDMKLEYRKHNGKWFKIKTENGFHPELKSFSYLHQMVLKEAEERRNDYRNTYWQKEYKRLMDAINSNNAVEINRIR